MLASFEKEKKRRGKIASSMHRVVLFPKHLDQYWTTSTNTFDLDNGGVLVRIELTGAVRSSDHWMLCTIKWIEKTPRAYQTERNVRIHEEELIRLMWNSTKSENIKTRNTSAWLRTNASSLYTVFMNSFPTMRQLKSASVRYIFSISRYYKKVHRKILFAEYLSVKKW